MWWPKVIGCATCRWVKPGMMVSACCSARSVSAPRRLASSGDDVVDRGAHVQADVGGDLVVARAARVQALAGVAHQFGQALFDVQVHVFQVEQPFEAAGVDFGP